VRPPANATNTGAECLWLAQRMTPPMTRRPGSRSPANGVWPERSAANLDGDHVGYPGTSAPEEVALEWTDAWGNPLVYIHHRDYGKRVILKLAGGALVPAAARRDPETGEWYQRDAYQLYSLGPDGKPGTADDITNWVR
jgi:hypothetical protein